MTYIIDGSEVLPNPLFPSFKDSPTVEISFSTRISESANGTETRVMRRRTPVIKVKYRSTVFQEDLERALEFLAGAGNASAIAAPDFRAMEMATVVRGARAITLRRPAPGFAAGRMVQISSGSFAMIAVIESVAGLTLTIDRDVPNAYPAASGSAHVQTVVPASLISASDVTLHTGIAGTVEVEFESFPGLHAYPIDPDAPVFFLGGGPEDQTIEIERRFESYGYGGRRIEVGGPNAFRPSRIITMSHRAMTAEGAEATRKFIDRCRGRLRAFDIPSAAIQSVAVSAASAANQFPSPGHAITSVLTYSLSGKRLHRIVFDGTPSLVVEPVQTRDPGADRRQLVDLTFGSRVVRMRRFFGDPAHPVVYEAISVSDGSNPNAFIAPATPPTAGRLISTYRLASDTVTLTYLSKSAFDAAIRCYELPDRRV